MSLKVLLVDGREEEVDADNWTITPEVGLRLVKITEGGNGQDVPVEYHPRFWVRVQKGDAIQQAKTPDVDDFTGGSGG